MNAKKMIAAFAILIMAFAVFAVIPMDGISGDDEKYVEMKGDFTSTLTMTSEQTVVVVDDLNIIAGGQLTILGNFIVKEGKTVTIEGYAASTLGDAKYSKLMLYGNATIDGNIVSKIGSETATDAGLVIAPGTNGAATDSVVTINGTVTALGDTSGSSKISADITASISEKNVVVNGNIVIGTNAEVTLSQVFFEKAGTLTVLGKVNGYIGLIGLAYLDGETANSFTIHIADATAKIEIISFGGNLNVTDKTMFAYAYGGIQYYIEDPAPFAPSTNTAPAIAELLKGTDKNVAANTINLYAVSNVRIAETVTTFMDYDEDKSQNMMCAETKMTISTLDIAKAVAPANGLTYGQINVVYGSKSVYFDTMTIQDIDVDVNGEATVVGDITFPVSLPSTKIEVDGTAGKLTVEGLILIKNSIIEGETSVVAAKYTIKDADNKVDAYYTTLQKAIDNGATDITMLGQLVVEKDTTVPEGAKLTTADTLKRSPATVEGECAVVIRDGATFTIANGAQFVAKGDVDVEGTFVIENIDYGIVLKLIWADVEVKDGSYKMYTNIYNAFAKAEAGAELNAYNPVNGKIVLDKDLTIPAGMSFSNEGVVEYTFGYSDDKMKTIEVGEGVILTVAGKLIMNKDEKLIPGSIYKWNSTITMVYNGNVVECSVVAIGPQGIIEFDTKADDTGPWDKRIVAGAYFADDTNYYITNIPIAFAGILDADDRTVYVSGDITIENINVAGTEKDRVTIVIEGGSEVTMKNFTFAYGSVVVSSGVKLNGDIGTATGKIILNDATVSAEATFNEVFIDDAMNLEVSGKIITNDTTEITGTVYIKGITFENDSSVPGFDFLEFDKNKFLVPVGTALFVSGDSLIAGIEFLIAGEATVMKNVTLTVPYLSVIGTLTVANTDGTPGTVSAINIIVGGTNNSFCDNVEIAGNALITGSGSFNLANIGYLKVFNGATVSADVLADWMANTAVSTEFYVDGALWMTTYVTDATPYAIAVGIEKTVGESTAVVTYYYNIPVLKDMEFNAWQTYDEKTKTYADIVVKGDWEFISVGQAGYEKVYANITKEIYTINVNADQGIDNVYIDGVLMQKTVATNSYTADVAAGTHTLSYTLANGYSGNAIITSIDGAKLVGGGLSFVVNDDKYDGPMDITLSGIQKSGYDTDPETHAEASSGLSVTEILLIVVVIIMAVMAVVLIMRLNRS